MNKMSSPVTESILKQTGKSLLKIARKFFFIAAHVILAFFLTIEIIKRDPVVGMMHFLGTTFHLAAPTSFDQIFELYGRRIKRIFDSDYGIPAYKPPPKATLSEMAGNLCFELDKRTLDIPKTYLAGTLTFKGVIYNSHKISQLIENERGNQRVRIWIDGDNFLKYYPDSKQMSSLEGSGQRLYLEWMDDKTKARYLDTKMHIYSDAWYGVGTLKNAKVKYLDRLNLYRTYQVTAIDPSIYWPEQDLSELEETFYGHPKKLLIPWTALKMAPRSLPDIPDDPFDYWLANCQYRQLIYSDRHSYCQSWFIDDSLLVEFDIKDFNLDKIDAIKQTIKAHLNEWSRPCTPSYLYLK